MTTALPQFLAVNVDEVAPIEVGPGCYRRDLPSTSNVRVWIVDMDPGSTWPYVDEHGTGEEIYIVSGEVIEEGRRYGAGTYIFFQPGSSHQPTTKTGVRIFGINLAG